MDRTAVDISDALAFAALKHRGQTDKQGAPYVYHVIAVAERVRPMGAVHEITALLHDVLEDTDTPREEIVRRFGETVASAVEALTKRPGEDYFAEYLPRVLENPVAVAVKIADLTDNLEKSATLPTVADREKYASKYRRALDIIATHVKR